MTPYLKHEFRCESCTPTTQPLFNVMVIFQNPMEDSVSQRLSKDKGMHLFREVLEQDVE